MLLTTLTRIELEDLRAQAKADYQHARNIGDTQGMQIATSDLSAIDIELAAHNNLPIKRHELPN